MMSSRKHKAIPVYISTTKVRGHDQSQVGKVMLSKLSLEDDIDSETELHEDRLCSCIFNLSSKQR
jgi:hypothetical protein